METEIEVKKKVDISKEDFEDYERVRSSGRTNMFDINTVIALSDNLTKEKCMAIMQNYEKLMIQYPDVRQED